MRNGHFADSNILVYASSPKAADSRKQEIATLLIEDLLPEISVQVLNEFLNTMTNPRKFALDRSTAIQLANPFQNALRVHSLSHQTHQLAMTWYEPQLLSLWDSHILASANLAGCTTLFSEDMNHGQKFGKVTIINPFREE